MEEYKGIEHNFEPVYTEESRILILGTFPSVKSREVKFYYGHPRNRFWKVLAGVLECRVPETISEKTEFLKENKIAVWDVIKSCDIRGSSDSSIKNVVPNDIGSLVAQVDIRKIYANGGTAKKLYDRYIKKDLQMEIELLPSTSPANAGFSAEKLKDAWKCIREYL